MTRKAVSATTILALTLSVLVIRPPSALAWSAPCSGPYDTSCLVNEYEAAGRLDINETYTHAEAVVSVPTINNNTWCHQYYGGTSVRAIWVGTGRSDLTANFEQDGIAWSNSEGGTGWYAWYQIPSLYGPQKWSGETNTDIHTGDQLKLWVKVSPYTNGGEVWFSVQNLTTGKTYPQIHSYNLGSSHLTEDGAEFYEENNIEYGYLDFPGYSDADGGATSWNSMYVIANGTTVAAGTQPAQQHAMYGYYTNTKLMDSTLGNTTTQTDHWYNCY